MNHDGRVSSAPASTGEPTAQERNVVGKSKNYLEEVLPSCRSKERKADSKKGLLASCTRGFPGVDFELFFFCSLPFDSLLNLLKTNKQTQFFSEPVRSRYDHSASQFTAAGGQFTGSDVGEL